MGAYITRPSEITSWLVPPVRRRPPRGVTKRLNRETRAARWELVHLAGCTERHCATNWWLQLIEPGDLPPRRVSVPRSLRPLLGRYIGAHE